MERSDLLAFVERHNAWECRELEDGGLVLAWWQNTGEEEPTTEHTLTADAIARNSLEVIAAKCKAGYDVDRITRVTGYFSKVNNWNKGKQAELRDRHRTPMGRSV